MSAQTIRDEMHKMIDLLDESKLEVVVNKWKEDLEIIGYRPNGETISLSDLKERIKESEKQIENGQFKTMEELRREATKWGLGNTK